MSLAIELDGGVEQREELVDLDDAARPAALKRLPRAPASCDIPSHEADILGLVEDRCQRAERLVDGLVRQGPQTAARSADREGCAGLSRGSDVRVLGVDPSAVLLDLLGCDLRGQQLAEEGRQVAAQLPFVELGRPRPDRRILFPGVEPIGGKLAERRLFVVVVPDASRAGSRGRVRSCASSCRRRRLDPRFVPALVRVAQRNALVGASDADAKSERDVPSVRRSRVI